MNVFVGQILQFGGNFVPVGYLPCDGRLVSISDYMELFNLIATTYGGDGQTTFGLPNLVGRVMIGAGAAASGTRYTVGQTGGAATVTLNATQSPSHGHALNVVNSGGSGTGQPGSTTYVASQTSNSQHSAYLAATPTTTMGNSTSASGASQPHNNMQPVLPVIYGIAVYGVYPTQN